MSQIRVERVPVKLFYLGLFGFDHLQIAYQQDDAITEQDGWYVLEGLRAAAAGGPSLGVLGTDGTTTLSEANDDHTGAALVADIGTPETRGSVRVNLTGSAAEAWETMASFGDTIDEQGLPYIAYGPPGFVIPTINSSSVVASLLFYADIDIRDVLPAGLRFSPGMQTLIGTSNDDELQIVNGFNALFGGDGKDMLEGGSDSSIVERFLGGKDDDIIKWSDGLNLVHGGQPRLNYRDDGADSIDYKGVGFVAVELNPYAIDHVTPEYVAVHQHGVDQLFSIEGAYFNVGSDIIKTGEGVDFLRDDLTLHFGTEDSSGRGDLASFATGDKGVLINSAGGDNYRVQSADNTSGNSAGIWLESAEWLEGSAGDDKIYGGETIRGLEGGMGNDILDARAAKAFSRDAGKFDVELFGGDGNDTLASGMGLSVATGGSGADRFVLSALSGGSQTVEYVIADADSSDRLFAPHEFFTQAHKGFDGSDLMPILGGFTQFSGQHSFNDLPENLGLWATGPNSRSDFAAFEWQTQDQMWNNNDATNGMFEFIGAIFFNREGGDLLIHVFSGGADVITELGHADLDWTHTVTHFDVASETIIRVKSFDEGDLGIQFHDRGDYESIDLPEMGGRPTGAVSYALWDAAVLAMTNGGVLTQALDLRPEAPTYDPGKSQQGDTPQLIVRGNTDDTITMTSGVGIIRAGGGNDKITTASGNDRIDGGTGADTMKGGGGNDSYDVDNKGDLVIELAGGGFDSVTSTISYTLTSNVEQLELSGAAVVGTGNNLDNRISGNDLDNILYGLDGADVLYGGFGNDILYGGKSSDAYVYATGSGNDLIIDEASVSDTDVLVLSGVTATDIHYFVPADSPLDLVLTFSGGGRVTLQGFMAGNGGSIDRIEFSDGTVWSKAELAGLAATAPIVSNDAPLAQDDLEFSVRSGTTSIASAALTANDIDFENDHLAIVSAGNATPGTTVTVDASGNVIVATSSGYAGLVDFDYTISDGHSESTAHVQLAVIANAAPVANGSLTEQMAQAGRAFTYTVPDGLFSDPDRDPLTLFAQLAGGAALPSWLHFNSATRTFSGMPPFGPADALDLTVVATDGSQSAQLSFGLSIEAAAASNIITGTAHNDGLRGTPLADIIIGLAGNDVMRGFDGDDRFVVGGAGNGFDIFIGGAGVDRITGGTGDDTIGLARSAINLSGIEIIDGGAGFDVLRLGPGGNPGPHAQDNVVNFSNIEVIGIELISAGFGDDRVTGSAGDDHIHGGRGDDVLRGGDGNDTFLFSGRYGGSDVLIGGSGYDRIAGGAGNDVIGLARGLTAAFGIEAIDGGGGRDVIRLTNDRDVLNLSGVAVTGIELISAGGGNDSIAGSSGDDRIRGGTGDDVFIFHGTFGHDVITDFYAGAGRLQPHDVIDLRGAGYANLAAVLAGATETADGTLIAVGTQGSILLEGVGLSQLKSYDFHL